MQRSWLLTSQPNSLFRANSESLTKYPLRRHKKLPSCTSDTFLHRWLFPAAVTTSPSPATTSLQQQLPSWTSDTFLQQLPPSCTNSYQWPPVLTTRLASGAVSPAPATTFLQQQLPVLHQQLPVLHQWPPIHRLPVLHQLSSPAPTTTFQQRRLYAIPILRFAIIKFSPPKKSPYFVILA